MAAVIATCALHVRAVEMYSQRASLMVGGNPTVSSALIVGRTSTGGGGKEEKWKRVGW